VSSVSKTDLILLYARYGLRWKGATVRANDSAPRALVPPGTPIFDRILLGMSHGPGCLQDQGPLGQMGTMEAARLRNGAAFALAPPARPPLAFNLLPHCYEPRYGAGRYGGQHL
jgi:hypothetical protein